MLELNPTGERRGTELFAEAVQKTMERETGFEPATSSLARKHSTTELLPLNRSDSSRAPGVLQRAERCRTSSSTVRKCVEQFAFAMTYGTLSRVDVIHPGYVLDTFVAGRIR